MAVRAGNLPVLRCRRRERRVSMLPLQEFDERLGMAIRMPLIGTSQVRRKPQEAPLVQEMTT